MGDSGRRRQHELPRWSVVCASWYERRMAKRRHDGELWLRQAADDFRFARLAVERKFFAQACFVAQQVGGKAAKAVHYHLGARPVIGRSVQALLRRLNVRAAVSAALVTSGGELDQYYVATRYPDALPGEPVHPPRV